MNDKIKVGITHGDTNGIGYEVILKALEDNRLCDLCTVVVYGSAKAASFYRKAMELPQVQFTRIDSAADAHDGVFNIVNVVGEDLKIEPGQASPAAGAAAFAALEAAVADLRDGKIDVLVTAPIDKHSIQSDSFRFPGHTEYLQTALTVGNDDASAARALMVLCTDSLRVALVTAHMPIAEVPSAISRELILEKLSDFDMSLRRDFAVHKPRIAVLALNPHSGERGLLGKEEEEEIIPALAEAQNAGILAFGPYAADGFFGSESYRAFDGVLAMYHDQGLAPFKTIAMDNGVNFTAGLPFVRTSPDHGTGYDIAGKGSASAESMRSAIYMAIDIFRNRASHEEAYSRPLRRQMPDKERREVRKKTDPEVPGE